MGMFRNVIVPGLMLTIASPLWAASGPFFSLRNTDFVVLISFILFAGIQVPLSKERSVKISGTEFRFYQRFCHKFCLDIGRY